MIRSSLEDSEMFNILVAIINDPILTSTGSQFASVTITEDNTDFVTVRSLQSDIPFPEGFGSVCICYLLVGDLERSVELELVQTGGIADAAEDVITEFPVPISLTSSSPSFVCAIHDDDIPEITEDLQIELRIVNSELSNQIMFVNNMVDVIIQDNDASLNDLAVGFVENSLELTEDIGASFDSICILVKQGNIDEILSFQINMALITWRYQWS